MAVYRLSATKANLLRAKETLARMQTGYELLDKKRIVLQRETAGLVARSRVVQKEINGILADYYRAMRHAFITVGSERVRAVVSRVPVDHSLDIVERSLMGVPVPEVQSAKNPVEVGYFAGDMALDQAVTALQRFRDLLPELAALENSVTRVQREIDKTQKRANALEKVQIPRYESMVREMEQVLEEKEREEFFRLKRVKKGRQKKREKTPI